MLLAFLLTGEQRSAEGLVLGSVFASGHRTGDRYRLERSTGRADEPLRGCAEERRPATREGEGRALWRARGQVSDRAGVVDRRWRLEDDPAREDDLVDAPTPDRTGEEPDGPVPAGPVG